MSGVLCASHGQGDCGALHGAKSPLPDWDGLSVQGLSFVPQMGRNRDGVELKKVRNLEAVRTLRMAALNLLGIIENGRLQQGVIDSLPEVREALKETVWLG